MWFIRLVTCQVELVQSQLEINKLLRQIQKNAEMMAVPKIVVESRKPLSTIKKGPRWVPKGII